MAGIKDLSTIWKNVKEIDLKPIRESATNPVRIALVGASESGRHTLAEQLRTDPARPGIHTQSPLALITMEAITEPPLAHLIIVLVEATRTEFTLEQSKVKEWSEGGKNVLVFVNKIDLVSSNIVGDAQAGWQASRVIYGSVNDISYLQREFVPTVLELLPQQHIALGRQFPLFRLPIARQLINEACFSNAAYSFSTGLAEIVPVLDLPLNMTDMVVLTKSQAFLAFKLGLLLGFSTHWQDYVTEFGSVIGTGFLWRQIARELIGLVPGWGIVPKVAVAYSGTYVVGNAILGWYLTGRNLSAKQMRALYAQAFTRGKDYARKLGERIPRPRLGSGRKEKRVAEKKTKELAQDEIILSTPSLPSGEESLPASVGPEVILASADEKVLLPVTEEARPIRKGKSHLAKGWPVNLRRKKEAAGRICPECGKVSSLDASFCQYCGKELA